MATHVMADIETFGTKVGSVIHEIGACKFNGDTILDRFHVAIDIEDAAHMGQTFDAKTVLYWMHPKRAEARERIFDENLPRHPLFNAVDGFIIWVNETPESELGSLWGKGSTFDNMHLQAAAERCNLPWPFTYRQDECYRTFANRFPDVAYEQTGTQHVGVDDAVSQAMHLQEICKAHGIAL